MITFEGVRLSYGKDAPPVLDGLTFAIDPGSIALVSGPTGCGKSTIARLISGIIPHLQSACFTGIVRLDGEEPKRLSVRQMCRKAGMVLQSVDHQIFTSTVAGEVAFGLENFAVPPERMDARIDEALELVSAQHLRDRQLSSLSGGEKQRAVLASVLALTPAVLILDEPLAYLDRQAAERLLTVLEQLRDSGVTVLMIEHRRELLDNRADVEIALRDGRRCEPQAAWRQFQPLSQRKPGRIVLEWTELSFGWGKESLLKNVHLTIHEGESVVIQGDNGSGKTTLLRLTLGLLNPSTGEIKISGRTIEGRKTREIANDAALVLQNPSHQLHLPTVKEEVMSRCGSELSAMEMLGRCGLESRANDHPHLLSQGQKRRLTIAAALAAKPKLLILDEPTVGQDDASLSIILRAIDDFLAEGGAVLTTSHDPRAIRSMGHRIYTLNEGQLAEEMEPNTTPQTESQEKRIRL